MEAMIRLLFFIVLALFLSGIAFFCSDAVQHLEDPDHAVRVVEVAIFKGAFGVDWHQGIAERFNEENKHRNIRIELWGDPRLANILKPRLLRGDPPDLILEERLPLWLLIGLGKLHPFTEALAQPAPGDDVQSWEDHYAPGMLNMFKSEGEVYAVPAAFGAWTCWYDAKVFREHGWSVPETWDEYRALCAAVKGAGIAPIALQGKYAYFYAWNTYITLLQRVGGVEAINRVNALEPDAFSHPDAVEAARLFQNLVTEYYQPGALAMTHTESQLQFIQGNTAMVFCGVWLEKEMSEVTPPEVELRSFDLPGNPDWKGNDAMLHGQGMEFLFVPTDAQYPEIAFEFARYLVSPRNAQDMGETIGAISPLQNTTTAENFSPAIGSVVEIINASPGIFNVRPYMLFPAWKSQVMSGAIQDLCRGDITPEEFGNTLDAGIASEVAGAEDPIPEAVLLDPAAYGEAHEH